MKDEVAHTWGSRGLPSAYAPIAKQSKAKRRHQSPEKERERRLSACKATRYQPVHGGCAGRASDTAPRSRAPRKKEKQVLQLCWLDPMQAFVTLRHG